MKLIRAKSMKKNGSIVKLKVKVVVERLQKSLLSGIKLFSDNEDDDIRVPNDVKEGHFAVMAEDGDGLIRRFIVPLSFLSHPSFLKLLERAAEEYGFDRDGALMVPCRPDELERILAREEEERSSRVSSAGAQKWSQCNKTLISTLIA